MKIERAVIFGATGAMGKSLTAELRNQNIQVRVVSRSASHLESAFGLRKVQKVVADIGDLDAAKRAAEGGDVIFHCVGLPAGKFPKHLDLSRNTLAAMQAAGARGVLIGSYWSYGPAQSESVHEEDLRAPVSEKGKIRREQEDLFQDAGAMVTILPDFYGPEADIGLINPALRAVESGKTANWVGPMDQPREAVYVPDAAAIIAKLAGHETAYGQRWNIGGPGRITPREILEIAARYADTELKVRTASPFILSILGLVSTEIRGIRELYPLYMNPPILNSQKAREFLDGYPETPYRQGIRKTIDWIRAGRD